MTTTTRIRLLLLLHHVLAIGIVAALIITLILGRASPLFPSHRMLGIALVALVILRVALRIAAMIRSRRGPPRGDHRKIRPALPRTPAAWITLAILPLILALAITGQLMTRGYYSLTSLHGLLAWALALAAVVHIAALIARSFRRPSGAFGREKTAGTVIDSAKV